MLSHKLFDFASAAPSVLDTTVYSDSVGTGLYGSVVYVPGVRDQNGTATGIITGGSGTRESTLTIEGAAEYDGASTVWVTLGGTSNKDTAIFSDFRVNQFAFTLDFPLMPVIRFTYTPDTPISGSQVYTRLEAWLVE